MSKQRYTPELKDEAVRQVFERGYGKLPSRSCICVKNFFS